MQAINQFSNVDLPEKPTLFLELTGSKAAVPYDLDVLENIVKSNNAVRFDKAQTADASSQMWQYRADALYASRALRPGIKGISTDVCVPVSRLPECIAAVQEVIATTSVTAPLVGHVGDGNFHLVLLFDPDNASEREEALHINKKLVEHAIKLGGTSTGEHGVGLGKKAYMKAEHGPALDLMRSIKRAVDPNNIMNPGKIFDLQ